MTNEQLAALVKQGGNDELIPILWERVRKIMYIKADRAYSAFQSRFERCGVDVWDLKQSCYIAFLKALEGYKPDSGNKFSTYLSYPFKNAVNELLGIRTQRAQNEPLNSCISLDTPLKDDEPDTTIADTIVDSGAVNAVELAEINDEYRLVHEAVEALEPRQRRVIKAYYFEGRTLKDIGAELNVTGNYVRDIRRKALYSLRFSPQLRDIYKETQQHQRLNSLQKYQTRPDVHLLIEELKKRYCSGK